MKLPLLCLAMLLGFNTVSCQTKIPAYGKIDEADLKITSCDFDKDADAYKLLKVGRLIYSRSSKHDFKIEIERRVRILILKENGIERANQKLKFYSKENYETIEDLKGATYNLEGGKITTTKLESKNVYTQKIDNKFSQVVFTMPAVKVGSIIEFKYTTYRESESDIDNWYFQDDIPTRISQYDINIPEYFEFTSQGITSFPMKVAEDDRQETSVGTGGSLNYKVYEKTYTMENIPGLRFEPYMTAPKDYIQQIQFQFSTYVVNFKRTDVRNTWEKMVDALKEDDEFGTQLKKNVSISDSLKANLKKAKSQTEKIKLIFDYVKSNMEFNGSATFWSPDGIKTALQKHSGTSGDLNLLLINLLRDAKIKANPVLVSSRDHGMINEMFPFMDQFDNVLAYVEEDNTVFVLDASDRYNPVRLVPFDYLNSKGYLIKDGKGEWVTFSSPVKYEQTVSVSGEISDAGTLKGSAFVRSLNYARNTRLQKWLQHKDKFDEYFTSSNYAALKIDDLKVENTETDSLPLEQRFNFETPLNSSGDYKYFSANLFLTFEKNPFTADTRLTDVDFGYVQHYSLMGSFKIPDDYTFEELPKNFALKLPDDDIVIKRLTQKEDNLVNINIDITINKTFFAPDEYDGLKEIYKRIYTLLNEQIVIKKK